MPTIAIASPKGGAGKSTTAVILATELAHAGVPVTLLDCDPNRSVSLWASRGTLPERIEVIADVSESTIIKTIKQYDRDQHIVVVDLEGVASRLMSRAISQADLVITPMRATTLDATVGARTIRLIAEEEEALGRDIPLAIAFTMTKTIRSKQHSGIVASLKESGVDVIEPDLLERSAFSALFEFGGDLYSMPAQGNAVAARENAAKFTQAVLNRLMQGGENV
ncbi:ParA family protein [Sphingomonas sp. CFBP 8760]|uniref:ParA family protein n=1 Tax=Sphingomonas sp. CFBP 8760 TaxID=2775282 RepID=UPI0017858C61|nr:ParA family protein [Sphingomonas sp. CFBP 8760]MBD8546690.1 ParA family protein [Sphingomonas sp. CFBP 8760]